MTSRQSEHTTPGASEVDGRTSSTVTDRDDGTGAVKAADVSAPTAHAPLRAPRQRRRARMPPWAICLVLAVVLGSLGALAILTRGFGLMCNATLASVTGMSEEDARARLEADGFTVTVVEQPTQSDDLGKVIATDPAAGTEVAPGSTVTLKVGASAGETREVPDLRGMSESQAIQTIDSSSWFVKDDVMHAYSDTVEAGRVIAQGPHAGAQKTKGTKVDLVVSDGPNPNGTSASGAVAGSGTITVPDVIGMPLADATQLLEDMGLTVVQGDGVPVSDSSAIGTVQRITPGVDGTVSPGDTVTIGVGTQE